MPATRCTPHAHLGDLFVPVGAENKMKGQLGDLLGREDKAWRGEAHSMGGNSFIYIRGYARDVLDLVGYTARSRCPVFPSVSKHHNRALPWEFHSTSTTRMTYWKLEQAAI